MKLKALALALFVAGGCTSLALADDGHGKGKKDDAETTAAATTGATTSTTEQHGQKGKAKEHGDKKVTLCHKAGHSGRWVEISVSKNAAKAHSRHGDVAPDSAGKCPAPTPATTTESTTTTTSASTNP